MPMLISVAMTPSQYHKVHNDIADRLATNARAACHGDLMLFLSDDAAARHYEYTKFIFAIHQHIVC